MATNTEKIVVQVVVKGGKQLDRLNKKTSSATKGVGGLTKGFAGMAAGIVVAVAAFRKVSQAIGSAIKSFRDFEFQMAKVRAVSGASNTDFLKLSKTAQELGRSTFFTAKQVAELQTNYAKLGFTTSEILDAQEATLDLAIATGSDLARAAIVAGAAVRGFGLDASETGRVVDVMAVTFASSAMDIEKWQTSMTKVAPIAKSAGFSIEDTAAIMAQLADSGIEASIAGTSLRNILLKMQDPSSDLTKSFGKTIHSFDELVPAMRGFVEEGGSMADVLEVVDLRQAAAFEQMITSAESAEILRDALLDANGAASEMAGIVGDNMEGAFKRFTSALEGLAINIVDGFIGKAITSFLGTITSIISTLNDFIDTSASLDEITAEAAGNFLKEGIALQNLADRYDTLNSKIDQNTSDRIEMDAILDTLKTKLGDSVIAIDSETSSLKLNRDALDAVIDRTALLADKEAIKLVHGIRNIDRAIAKETKTLDGNSESLKKQQRLLLEKQKTQDDVTKGNLTYSQSTAQMTDEEGELISTRFEGNVINKETAEQEIVINELKATGRDLTSSITAKEAARKEKLDLLAEAGFDMASVERLLGQEIETTTTKTVTSTKATTENTKAKTDNSAQDKVRRRNLQIEVKLQELLLDNKITQEQFDDLFYKKQIKNIQSVLDNELMTHPQRLALQKQLNDLKLKGMTDEETARQKQIDGVAELGNQLINLAGEDEKMQAIRKVGIQISAAAAIANNLLALSNAAVGVSEQSKLLFPYNIIAMASTLATVFSLFANIKALKDSFGSGGMIEEFANGGMVNGKSHSQGGEKFAVGGRVVELEGGEAVINKRSTAMFRPQLSAMNSAGGGVRFADGGLLNQPSFSQQQFNALGQNQMMGAMGGSRKVVVVEADITDSQDSVSVIQAQATI